MPYTSDTFFTIEQDGAFLRLPYFSSHLIDGANSNIEMLILAIHGADGPPGAGSDVSPAETYLNMLMGIASTIPNAVPRTLVISPQLLGMEYLEVCYGAGRVPTDIMYDRKHAGDGGRFVGGSSDNPAVQISFFTAIDAILDSVCHSGCFPNLQRIVIVGHSAGGQFVNRYAASSPFQCLGVSIRYIILNPSSYLYFNDERWVPYSTYQFGVPSVDTKQKADNATPKDCSDASAFNTYNNYPYGLVDTCFYHERNRILPAAMIARYRSRNIIHLVGQFDTASASLDDTCIAMLQGNNRKERAEIYWEYLQHFFGPGITRNQCFEVIPGVGHSGGQMMVSNIGQRYIFDPLVLFNMKTLADYIVIDDTPHEIIAGREMEFEFTTPTDMVYSSLSKRPILAFQATSTGIERCIVEINDVVVKEYSYTGTNDVKSHWEVLTHENLKIGDRNTVKFRVSGGRGRLKVSDIILWCQRNV